MLSNRKLDQSLEVIYWSSLNCWSEEASGMGAETFSGNLQKSSRFLLSSLDLSCWFISWLVYWFWLFTIMSPRAPNKIWYQILDGEAFSQCLESADQVGVQVQTWCSDLSGDDSSDRVTVVDPSECFCSFTVRNLPVFLIWLVFGLQLFSWSDSLFESFFCLFSVQMTHLDFFNRKQTENKWKHGWHAEDRLWVSGLCAAGMWMWSRPLPGSTQRL